MKLNIELVPLPLVTSEDGVVFDPCTQVFRRNCCPDPHRRIDDRSAVTEHLGDYLAGLVCDVHITGEAGSGSVVGHDSTVVLFSPVLRRAETPCADFPAMPSTRLNTLMRLSLVWRNHCAVLLS